MAIGNSEPQTGGDQIARLLRDAIVRSDEDLVVVALRERPTVELTILREAYRTLAGRDVDKDLAQKDMNRALFALRGPDGALLIAGGLSEALRHPKLGKDSIAGALSGRTYPEWGQIRDAYQKLAGQRNLDADLEEFLRSSFTPWGDGSTAARAAEAAKAIRTGLLAGQVGKDQILLALTGRTRVELDAIVQQFGNRKGLVAGVERRMSASTVAEVHSLLGEPALAMALRLNEELESFRPSKDRAVALAGGRDPVLMTQMQEEFAGLTGAPLTVAIEAKFGVDGVTLQPLSRFEHEGFRRAWESELAALLDSFTRRNDDRKPAACGFPTGAAKPDESDWVLAPDPRGTRVGHRAMLGQTTDPTAPGATSSAEERPREKGFATTPKFRPLGAVPPNEATRGTLPAWTPRNADPYAAAGKLAIGFEAWECDCAMFVEVAWLITWRKLLTADEFNRRFDGLKVRRHHTTGLPREYRGNGFFSDQEWDDAPIGSKVTWLNGSAAAHPPWGSEHAVRSRKTSNPADARYYAHPLGGNMTEDQITSGLAAYSSDYPDVVFEFDDDRLDRFAEQVASAYPEAQRKREQLTAEHPNALTLCGLDANKARAIAERAKGGGPDGPLMTPQQIGAWVTSLVEELRKVSKAISLKGAGKPDKGGATQIWGQEFFLTQLIGLPMASEAREEHDGGKPYVAPSALFVDALQGSGAKAVVVTRALLDCIGRQGTDKERQEYVKYHIYRFDLSIPL